MGSRNSASVLSGSGGADERRTRASRISYLQIQTGRDFADAQAWGDQVVLRRDQYGGWVVVDAGEDTGERSVGDYEDDDAGSSEKSEKLDHEEVGKW